MGLRHAVECRAGIDDEGVEGFVAAGVLAKLRRLRHRFGVGVARNTGRGGSLQFLQRDKVLRGERLYLRAAKLGDVAETAEITAKVTGQRADIGALAAFDLEMGMVGAPP